MDLSACAMSDSVTPGTVALQGPLSLEFSRQGYWSGLPFPLWGIFLTQDQTCVSYGCCTADDFFTSWTTGGSMVLNQTYLDSVNIQWNIVQPSEGMEYRYFLQQGLTLKTLFWLKAARHKRPCIIWVHLYEISRIDKLIEIESRLGIAKGWSWEWEMGNDYLLGSESSLGMMKMFY